MAYAVLKFNNRKAAVERKIMLYQQKAKEFKFDFVVSEGTVLFQVKVMNPFTSEKQT